MVQRVYERYVGYRGCLGDAKGLSCKVALTVPSLVPKASDVPFLALFSILNIYVYGKRPRLHVSGLV